MSVYTAEQGRSLYEIKCVLYRIVKLELSNDLITVVNNNVSGPYRNIPWLYFKKTDILHPVIP